MLNNTIPHFHQKRKKIWEDGGEGQARAAVMLLIQTKFSKPDYAVNQNGPTNVDFSKSPMGRVIL